MIAVFHRLTLQSLVSTFTAESEDHRYTPKPAFDVFEPYVS
ncbi:MAG: hypothetical protein ACMXYM_04140 [Candidatus Woesearchaeota archaeon]